MCQKGADNPLNDLLLTNLSFGDKPYDVIHERSHVLR